MCIYLLIFTGGGGGEEHMCVRHGVFMEVRGKKNLWEPVSPLGWGLRAKLRATRLSSKGCDVISATPGEFLDMGSLTQLWGAL